MSTVVWILGTEFNLLIESHHSEDLHLICLGGLDQDGCIYIRNV